MNGKKSKAKDSFCIERDLFNKLVGEDARKLIQLTSTALIYMGGLNFNFR